MRDAPRLEEMVPLALVAVMVGVEDPLDLRLPPRRDARGLRPSRSRSGARGRRARGDRRCRCRGTSRGSATAGRAPRPREGLGGSARGSPRGGRRGARASKASCPDGAARPWLSHDDHGAEDSQRDRAHHTRTSGGTREGVSEASGASLELGPDGPVTTRAVQRGGERISGRSERRGEMLSGKHTLGQRDDRRAPVHRRLLEESEGGGLGETQAVHQEPLRPLDRLAVLEGPSKRGRLAARPRELREAGDGELDGRRELLLAERLHEVGHRARACARARSRPGSRGSSARRPGTDSGARLRPRHRSRPRPAGRPRSPPRPAALAPPARAPRRPCRPPRPRRHRRASPPPGRASATERDRR